MSNAMFLLAVIAYEVAAFLAARMVYPRLLGDVDGNDPVYRLMTALMALFGGHLWPLAAPAALVLWKPRKTPAQLQVENEQMKLHIAELERELGIGGRR